MDRIKELEKELELLKEIKKVSEELLDIQRQYEPIKIQPVLPSYQPYYPGTPIKPYYYYYTTYTLDNGVNDGMGTVR